MYLMKTKYNFLETDLYSVFKKTTVLHTEYNPFWTLNFVEEF